MRWFYLVLVGVVVAVGAYESEATVCKVDVVAGGAAEVCVSRPFERIDIANPAEDIETPLPALDIRNLGRTQRGTAGNDCKGYRRPWPEKAASDVDRPRLEFEREIIWYRPSCDRSVCCHGNVVGRSLPVIPYIHHPVYVLVRKQPSIRNGFSHVQMNVSPELFQADFAGDPRGFVGGCRSVLGFINGGSGSYSGNPCMVERPPEKSDADHRKTNASPGRSSHGPSAFGHTLLGGEVISARSKPLTFAVGLHARYDARRVNHSIAFKDQGACTNQAESYFSRLRRAEIGQHHCILAEVPRRLRDRDGMARGYPAVGDGSLYMLVAAAAAAHPVIRQWKGYWQR